MISNLPDDVLLCIVDIVKSPVEEYFGSLDTIFTPPYRSLKVSRETVLALRLTCKFFAKALEQCVVGQFTTFPLESVKSLARLDALLNSPTLSQKVQSYRLSLREAPSVFRQQYDPTLLYKNINTLPGLYERRQQSVITIHQKIETGGNGPGRPVSGADLMRGKFPRMESENTITSVEYVIAKMKATSLVKFLPKWMDKTHQTSLCADEGTRLDIMRLDKATSRFGTTILGKFIAKVLFKPHLVNNPASWKTYSLYLTAMDHFPSLKTLAVSYPPRRKRLIPGGMCDAIAFDFAFGLSEYLVRSAAKLQALKIDTAFCGDIKLLVELLVKRSRRATINPSAPLAMRRLEIGLVDLPILPLGSRPNWPPLHLSCFAELLTWTPHLTSLTIIGPGTLALDSDLLQLEKANYRPLPSLAYLSLDYLGFDIESLASLTVANGKSLTHLNLGGIRLSDSSWEELLDRFCESMLFVTNEWSVHDNRYSRRAGASRGPSIRDTLALDRWEDANNARNGRSRKVLAVNSS